MHGVDHFTFIQGLVLPIPPDTACIHACMYMPIIAFCESLFLIKKLYMRGLPFLRQPLLLSAKDCLWLRVLVSWMHWVDGFVLLQEGWYYLFIRIGHASIHSGGEKEALPTHWKISWKQQRNIFWKWADEKGWTSGCHFFDHEHEVSLSTLWQFGLSRKWSLVAFISDFLLLLLQYDDDGCDKESMGFPVDAFFFKNTQKLDHIHVCADW